LMGFWKSTNFFPQFIQADFTVNPLCFKKINIQKSQATQGKFQFSTVSAAPNITITTYSINGLL
jgi:hypothetical protein